MPVNEFGQPVGESVPDWTERERPAPDILEGHHVRLEPLKADHAEPLFESLCADASLWTYRGDDPPTDVAEMSRYVATLAAATDRTTYAVVPRASGTAAGMSSLLRDDPLNGVIEIGAVIYGPQLQRTAASTEASYLLARHVFDDLGYRRLEWKLDSLNEPSAQAARRLGFTEEGTFGNHMVYKGRSRDTTWFAITDQAWPQVRQRLEDWLDPANFDDSGRQRRPLR